MISIKVPPLGESIVEATVSRWLKNEGDAVAAGETLVELETDKITVEVPALKAGTLTKRSHGEGDVVKVDDILGELDETRVGVSAGSSSADGATAAGPRDAGAVGGAPVAREAASAPPAASAGTQKSSPAARNIGAEKGVDISSVAGTGRGGVVSKPDVIGAITGGAGAPPTPASGAPRSAPAAPTKTVPTFTGGVTNAAERETREKMSTRRKRIAENLLQSQHATAHLTTFNEVDMSALNSLRDKFKEKVEKQYGVKLTFMPFFVKAACVALRDFPTINAQVDGDSIIYKHYVNMGIAVASDQGLVVPNIKDADRKGTLEISQDISNVAKRARDTKLTMDDLTGGTFTITNGGVFGSLVSTPIINFPQVGILGLHKTQDRPVAIDGQVVVRPMMYIALSYDHRIVEGQQAVQFLVRVKELIEDPAAMLIE
ncbi:MAG: 2-oxoglutarate dehydrogenase complex dihydrolipoyllysine-residue succinyltransferase [Gemmatimonadaceae bacterium]|nr:2-oxoglutarate dehydrogenase complex dihydrolipoyllysine-residue succinyltransferase [Gemmatimonadaceae bacterium]